MTIESEDLFGREIAQRLPVKGIRKLIAQRMRESLDRSPQGTAMVKLDLSKVVDFRNELLRQGKVVSYTDLFVKMTCLILEKYPIFNSSLQGKNIFIFRSINIGIAVFVNENLYVPVIKDCQDKTVFEISKEIREVIEHLKEGRLNEVTLSGSTFSVNNLGMYEVDGFTPFINPPEAAILGIGRIQREAAVTEIDTIEIRSMVTLSLTNDHSIIDGVPVGRFFTEMKKMLEHPEEYLLKSKMEVE